MSNLRVASLLALRQAGRQRARTVAIIATLTLPIAVVTAMDVVIRTTHLNRAEQLNRELGGAQALVRWENYGYGIKQLPDPEPPGASGPILPAPTTAQASQPQMQPAPSGIAAGLLPSGSIAVEEIDASSYFVSSLRGTGVQVRGVDLRNPTISPLVRVEEGRLPNAVGEVTLSPGIARSLGVKTGDPLQVPNQQSSLRVVGIVRLRYQPRTDVVFSTSATATSLGGGLDPQWYIESSSPLRWEDVLRLNAAGFVVTSRAVVLHPPPRSAIPALNHLNGPSGYLLVGGGSNLTENGFDFRTGTVSTALLGGMVLLEVVLLAGPAFAVGLRRRRDELALFSAAGGNRYHLLAIVTTDGMILGAVAALLGAATGIASGVGFAAAIRHWSGRVPGSVTIRAGELTALALLAVLSGLLASLLPALSASRQDPAQVLRGRQRVPRLTARPSIGGVLLVGAAVGVALGKLDERSTSGFPAPLVLAAALGEIGFALITPGILTVFGKTAGRLPVWTRLALRDASRNRSAAAPAAAAIIAVVAATAATLVFWSTVNAHDRRYYQPNVAVGDAVTAVLENTHASTAVTKLRADLPGSTVLDLRGPPQCGPQATNPCLQASLRPPPSPPCPRHGHNGFGFDIIGSGPGNGPFRIPGCPPLSSTIVGQTLVDGGPTIAALVGGQSGSAAERALSHGVAVVFDSTLLDHGRATISFTNTTTSTSGSGSSNMQQVPGPPDTSVPAVFVPSSVPTSFVGIVLPPEVASRVGLAVTDVDVYVKNAARLPPNQLQAANDDLTRQGFFGLSVEHGYHDVISPALWTVIAGDLVLTLGAAIIATALMTIDARDDLMTLAAVGAAPRTRRRLAMARAGVICAIGAVFGAAAGLLPGIGLVWRLRHISGFDLGPVTLVSAGYPLSIPWSDLALVGLAAPLVAVAAAAAITRARLPVERRRIG